MSRHAAWILALSLAGFGGASPKDAPKPAKAKTTAEVRERLGTFHEFTEVDDPKTTLADYLREIDEKQGVLCRIDETAFKAARLDAKALVVGRHWDPSPITLHRYLTRILGQLGPDLAFDVADGAVHITTFDGLAAMRVKAEPEPVNAETKKRRAAVLAALKTKITYPEIDDPKARLGDLLEVLGSVAVRTKAVRLAWDYDDRAFRWLSRSCQIRDERCERQAEKKGTVEEILRTILKKLVVGNVGAVFVVQSDGTILITTAWPVAWAKTTAEVRARLGTFHEFEEIERREPATLADCLWEIEGTHGVVCRIDEAAFKAAQLDAGELVVGKLTDTGPITLHRHLTRRLERLRPNLAFFVAHGAIRITTFDGLAAMRVEAEPMPVNAETKKRHAAALATLKKKARLHEVEDPKATPDDLMFSLNRHAGLAKADRFSWDIRERAFRAAGRMAIRDYRLGGFPGMSGTVEELVRAILRKIEVDGDKAVFLVQSDGTILITTGKALDKPVSLKRGKRD